MSLGLYTNCSRSLFHCLHGIFDLMDSALRRPGGGGRIVLISEHSKKNHIKIFQLRSIFTGGSEYTLSSCFLFFFFSFFFFFPFSAFTAVSVRPVSAICDLFFVASISGIFGSGKNLNRLFRSGSVTATLI